MNLIVYHGKIYFNYIVWLTTSHWYLVTIYITMTAKCIIGKLHKCLIGQIHTVSLEIIKYQDIILFYFRQN